MKRNITGSLLILVYVNLVPYLCRLVHGFDWMRVYLPENIGGVLFALVVNSLAAGPLILMWWLRKVLPVTWILTFIATTATLGFIHHDYDLASDAQAAIGLIFFPIIAAAAGTTVGLVAGTIEAVARRRATRPATTEVTTP